MKQLKNKAVFPSRLFKRTKLPFLEKKKKSCRHWESYMKFEA